MGFEMQRKLFYAIDASGKRVMVDDLNDNLRSMEFSCPYCKAKVIPKMGDKTIWHFSHSGDCKVAKDKELSLDSFSSSTISMDDIKFETDKFTCKLCNNASKKENGIDLHGKWICKECYRSSDVARINELLR